ncbi:MAG: 3-isopropylmalate dehydrogenase [Anaerolineales bacterium]|nr:3-isopropylmalate dehydrogenase [Anaerolineales bacterium]
MDAKITLLPGDGIGPDIVAETRKVLDVVAAKYGHTFSYTEQLIGGIAIDETGVALPEATLGACLNSDAVLMGSVGGPKWDDPRAKVRPEQGILGLRKGLNVFANVRPVKVFDALADASPLKSERVKGVDLIILRELTGGIYFGSPQGRDAGENGRFGYNTMIYNEVEIRRIVEIAFDLARKRRKKVTSVDKANVLATSRVWREVAQEVADENPDIEYEVVLVDAMAMYLINKPAAYDVVVTGNLFGDILSDEASMITGSLGMLPSASLGLPGTPGLYEPIHGSAPDIAGKGIANPLATILSAAMMLRSSLDLDEEATAMETAVSQVLAAGHRTADIAKSGEKTVGTTTMGDLVIEALG